MGAYGYTAAGDVAYRHDIAPALGAGWHQPGDIAQWQYRQSYITYVRTGSFQHCAVAHQSVCEPRQATFYLILTHEYPFHLQPQ